MFSNFVLHDDYEYFAEKYLGIDYDDYVELVNDFELSEGELEVEYEMSF
jgi:hypothetical protein